MKLTGRRAEKALPTTPRAPTAQTTPRGIAGGWTTAAKIVQLASDPIGPLLKGSKLAKPGQSAVRRQKERQLAQTFKRGRYIFKVHSNGTQEILGEVEPLKFHRPPGVTVLR